MNKIRERLYIGDIQDAREGDTSQFDVVISICQDNVEHNVGCKNIHFPLSDGEPTGHVPGKFSYKLFSEAVDTIIEAVENEKNTLVHCHKGRNRSVMAAVSALSILENLSYEEASRDVKAARPPAKPSEEMKEFGKKYIENHE